MVWSSSNHPYPRFFKSPLPPSPQITPTPVSQIVFHGCIIKSRGHRNRETCVSNSSKQLDIPYRLFILFALFFYNSFFYPRYFLGTHVRTAHWQSRGTYAPVKYFQ